MNESDKEKIVNIVDVWRSRSGLDIQRILSRIQAYGLNISRSQFENRFVRLDRTPDIDPEYIVAIIAAFGEGLTQRERCTAAEATQLAKLTRLPVDQFEVLAKYFSEEEFREAIRDCFPSILTITSGDDVHTYVEPNQPQDPEENVSSSSGQKENLVDPTLHPVTGVGLWRSEIPHLNISAAKDYVPFTVPPLPIHGVFGRNEFLHNIVGGLELATLDHHQVPPLALLGMGGIGKTTVAKALAHMPEVIQAFPHGVLWTELGPRPSVRVHLEYWGEQLGVNLTSLSSIEACSQRLRGILYHRKVLLILDDIWDSATGTLFMLGGQKCRIIFTTRELPVANDLATPRRIYRVSTISPEASLDLLRNLAEKTVIADEAAAMRLCEKLEFHPLAITLAGRYLTNEALTARRRHSLIQQLLSHATERLKLPQFEKRLGIKDENPSLRAVLGLSVERLDRVDQERFAVLSVLGSEPLSWTLDRAAFLWDCTAEQADATITRFIQRGLVEKWTNRFRMHALLADYANVLREEWKL